MGFTFARAVAAKILCSLMCYRGFLRIVKSDIRVTACARISFLESVHVIHCKRASSGSATACLALREIPAIRIPDFTTVRKSFLKSASLLVQYKQSASDS